MRVAFEVFEGTWTSWEKLFRQAAEFAGQLEPEQLISISHSEDKDDGVVTVWYWQYEEADSEEDAADQAE